MSANQLTLAKQRVQDSVGKQVNFRINKGRNKIVKFKGTITQVYPAMFVISTPEQVELDKLSYSYFDMVCGDIDFKDN